ncbi:hypothetical protein [Nocardioides sp. Root151]|uniref:hypothetical protein n=1 Tax=Nocardioides sp. Root151 TaxID=1736475 RepID=UPI000ADF5B16|nr:hypothetical protein [Nocardioides sp. Root151]
MSNPDFVTVDAFDRPAGGRIRWRRNLRRVLGGGIEGLRGASVNYSNNATHTVPPGLLPGGCALVAAWESPEAAEAAFAGPLRRAIDGPDRFSLDGEIVRVRIDSESSATTGTDGSPEPTARSHWRRMSRWSPSSTAYCGAAN